MERRIPKQPALCATQRTQAFKLLDVKQIKTQAFVNHY
jgi:hypothetical protein